MAQEVVIKIRVDGDSDIQQLEKDIKKLANSTKQVEENAEKTSKTLQDGIEGAESAAENLRGGLGGIVTQYKTITKAAKSGGKAMRSAMLSTGVGILIVALEAIVSNWEDIYNWITGANERLERQKELSQEINKELRDRQTIENTSLQLQKRQEQRDILKAKIAGKSEAEITAIRRKGIEDRIEIYRKEAEESSRILTESSKADLDTYRAAVKNQKEAYAQLSAARFELEIFDLESQLPSGKKGKELQKRDDTSSVKGLLSNAQIVELENFKFVEESKLELLATRMTKEEALEKTRLAFKQDILAQEAGLLSQFTGILQQLDEDNKAFAVAGIIADQIASAAKTISATGEANAKAVAAFPLTAGQPWVTINTASAALSIASGALSAKKAISQLGGSGGGASLGGLSGGSGGGVSAPSFNIVGTSGTNQLAESLQQDQQPIQAYVVGSNVTTQQELDRNIVDTATIG